MKDLRKICVTQCPQLDAEHEKRCIECPGDYIHSYFSEHGCCPVGNIPYWVPLVEENK